MGNRISSIRSRKRKVARGLRPKYEDDNKRDKFEPNLLKGMNISYTNADRFREKNPKIERQSVSSKKIPEIKTANTVSTMLTDAMNISYMDSKTFRSQHHQPRKDNLGQDLTGYDPRTRVNLIKRRRIRVNPSQKNKSFRGNNGNVRRQPTITANNKSVQYMAWLWPPNTMDFSGLNFDLFDSQFVHRKPTSSPRLNEFPKNVPFSGQEVDLNTGRYTIAVLL